jgi:hypothetical protein
MPNDEPASGSERRRFQPIAAAGPIAADHEGPYIPTLEEILEGARAVADAKAAAAESEARQIEERVRHVFRNWGGVE